MKLLINGKSRKIMYNEKENMYYYKCNGGTVDASKYFLKGDKVGSLTEGSLKKQCRKMLVGGDLSIIQLLKKFIEFLLPKIQSYKEAKIYEETLKTLKTLETLKTTLNKDLNENVNSISNPKDGQTDFTNQNDVSTPDTSPTLDCDTKLALIKLIVCDTL
tara:strand:+ start:1503 stop:1982 length:480 start_codon:yes stop_codon:yes gene_type:complete